MNDSKLKICIFDKQGSGCSHYRSWLPGEEMRRLGHKVIYAASLEDVDIEKDPFDIVVISRLFEGDFYTIIEFLKWRGIKVVYETDDGLDILPAVNPAYPMTAKGRRIMAFFLREADLVTVTTERLANHVAARRKGKPVLITPNCASPDNPKRKKENSVLRLGFAGSISHLADVLPVLDAIIALQDDHAFKFVLFGYTEKHDSWQAFVDECLALYESHGLHRGAVATALRALNDRLSRIRPDVLEWQKAVSLAEYPAKLASLDLDLGVCPLEETLFNSMKSVCKVMEYATAGTSFLAANVPPYSDVVPKEWLVKDWKEALEKFMMKPDILDQSAQLAWVVKTFDIKRHTEERLKAYQSIL